MSQIVYVSWDGLFYYDKKIKQYISDQDNLTLKYAGEVEYDALPEPFKEYNNYLFKVVEEFNTELRPGWFYEEGIYPANTFVQIITKDDDAKYAIFNQPNDDRYDELDKAIIDLTNEIKILDDANATLANNLNTTTTMLSKKQDLLVSGENIATVNGQSLLDNKDIVIDPDDQIYFTDKPVAIHLGGFSPGMHINDKTIAELFEILLCNTFAPELPILIEQQIYGMIPGIYSGATTSPRNVSAIEQVLCRETAETKLDISRNCVYEIVDENSIIKEVGYQLTLSGYGKGNYATIFIPASFSIKNIQIYDKLSNQWVPYNGTFNSYGELLMIDTILYQEYIDSISNNRNALNHYRFVIERNEVTDE